MKGNKKSVRCSVCYLECFVWSGHQGPLVCYSCEQKTKTKKVGYGDTVELPDWVGPLVEAFDDGDDLHPEKRVTRCLEKMGITFTSSDK